ncbi:hypothetical protein E1181_28485 [Saccharopolyspora terrae]|uniref:Uncharacterized protein n=1 Tax=Saccharopolyspora terrae TaxID=2530384 RepID=A0A4R4VDA4_9PSEU|nr:terpene synthase family protein [Saccharopolyspora terrae]TDC99944.1 hypothetical protein E1181_28485 [Saccharopolyspora terrae]
MSNLPTIELVETCFTDRVDPRAHDVAERTCGWLIDQGIATPEIAARYHKYLCTTLVPRCYIGGSWAAVAAINDFMVWVFIYDDYFFAPDRAWPSTHHDLAAAAKDPEDHEKHSDPMVRGLANIVRRFYAQGMGTEWESRFARHLAEIFAQFTEEHRQRSAGYQPTEREYMALRHGTWFTEAWVDLAELNAGSALPKQMREEDPYRSVMDAAQIFCVIHNDMVSLPMELAAGHTHNLGAVFMGHEGLTRAEALDKMRTLAAGYVERFLNAEQRMLAELEGKRDDVSEACRACMRTARDWIGLSRWYNHASPRYSEDEFTGGPR